MVSDFAINEIEQMQRDGLHPTPADIIRLNALGLAVERGPDAAALYTLRRAVKLTPHLTLREPTIAHAVFFAECLRLSCFKDISDVQFVALRAWTLSLDAPPAAAPSDRAVSKALDAFISGPLKPATLSQTVNAIDYCIHGISHTDGEYPEPDIDPDNPPPPPPEDFLPELAIVSDAFSLGLGISLDDARRLTPSRLAAIVQRAKDSNALNGQNRTTYTRERRNKALADFNRTADAIRARLAEDSKEAPNNG